MANLSNPKQVDSTLIDLVPQIGPCPNGCNQCYYNRPDVYYAGFEPVIPSQKEAKGKIIRVNCGNDSNNQRDLVIESALKYQHFFFNTSIPRFDFPGPVVYTANPKEEEQANLLVCPMPYNLMYVRLRVSASNLFHIRLAVEYYTMRTIPVVLTFMRYYDSDIYQKMLLNAELVLESYKPFVGMGYDHSESDLYQVRKHIKNSYWCPTSAFMRNVLAWLPYDNTHLVQMCGTPCSSFCKDCNICVGFYYLTLKRMRMRG